MVDELHTFDGAQGTDLALLLRRLRARLQMRRGPSDLLRAPPRRWAAPRTPRRCASTRGRCSAVPFRPRSVITENRLVDGRQFLGDTTIEHVLQPAAGFRRRAGSRRGTSPAGGGARLVHGVLPRLPQPPTDVNGTAPGA